MPGTAATTPLGMPGTAVTTLPLHMPRGRKTTITMPVRLGTVDTLGTATT